MNLQDAVDRCQSDKLDYPVILDSKSGLYAVEELGVVGIPSWGRFNPNNKRKAILEIKTWKGISSDAIHFYGKIVVDGVYTATLSNLEIPKNLSFEQERKYPLLNYRYELKVKRPLTREELRNDPNRWGDYYDEGDLVEGYEKIDDLINDAKEIFMLRFTGQWDFFVQYPKGEKKKIIFDKLR